MAQRTAPYFHRMHTAVLIVLLVIIAVTAPLTVVSLYFAVQHARELFKQDGKDRKAAAANQQEDRDGDEEILSQPIEQEVGQPMVEDAVLD
jgi:hypothetical protein